MGYNANMLFLFSAIILLIISKMFVFMTQFALVCSRYKHPEECNNKYQDDYYKE